MSTETSEAPGDPRESLVGAHVDEDSSSSTDKALIPSSIDTGHEQNVNEYDKTALGAARREGLLDPNAPDSTADLPPELGGAGIRNTDAPELGTEKRSHKKVWVASIAAVAVAASGVGAALFLRGKQEPPKKLPAASAPAVPGTTPTETAPSTNTGEVAPGVLSREQVAARLEIPSGLLDVNYYEQNSLDKNPAALQALFERYGAQNPNLKQQFLLATEILEGNFANIPLSDYLDAQDSFRHVENLTMYDTDALKQGRVVPMKVGEFFTQPKFGGEPFPTGLRTEENLKGYVDSIKPTGQDAGDAVAGDVFEATRIQAPLSWEFQNEVAVEDYNRNNAQKLTPSLTTGELAKLGYFKSVKADGDIAGRVSNAENGGSAPGRTDGFIVKVLKREKTSESDPQVYGIITAYVQDGKLVLESSGLVPLSGDMAYKDGKPLGNTTILQPVYAGLGSVKLTQ